MRFPSFLISSEVPGRQTPPGSQALPAAPKASLQTAGPRAIAVLQSSRLVDSGGARAAS